MDFSLKRALEVAVIFACAIGVGSTAIIMTNNNNDRTKNKNDGLWSLVDKNGNEGDNSNTGGDVDKTPVSKTESQVGKYADIDGDGTVDGIIFADLMVGGNGTWDDYGAHPLYNERGIYTIPTISSSKDYYVSQKSYTNQLGGTADVLTPTGDGNDRFYIMALSDISSSDYTWYNAAYGSLSDYNTITSQDFGKGKANTATMIEKWNAKAYGVQSSNDLWGQIQTQTNDGWFVPSSKEWAAFAKNIGVATSNYLSKGLSKYYWSSSLYSPSCACAPYFPGGYVSGNTVNGNYCVRLAATF